MKKILKKMKEPEYGFVNGNNEICINIEKLWGESGDDVGAFADGFALTHSHELMHVLIAKMVKKKIPLVLEEKAIRALLNEEWNKKLEQLYIEDEN